MNVKEYIESGILEAYALGALPEEERIQVAADIAMYPELAKELADIERALTSYAEAHAETPPAALQEQIWNAVSENKSTHKETVVPPPTTKQVPLQPEEPRKRNNWMQAAIWAAIIVSVATNFILLSQRNESRDEQEALAARVDSMSAEQNRLAKEMSTYKYERDVLADPSTVEVQMGSVKENKDMKGVIYWNKGKQEAYLALQNMPVPPQGKQYQLWVIQDGKPVDMGVIPNSMLTGADSIMKVSKLVASGQAFAISLEKEGGSPTPNMEEIHVMGAVSS